MDVNEYQRLAQRTKSEQFHVAVNSVGKGDNAYRDMLHAAIGIATEGGEILDAFKKNMFYGKRIDVINVIEEGGDVLWYVAVLATACGVTLEDMMRINIEKLQARYPEKFDSSRSLNRDLFTERQGLEAGVADAQGVPGIVVVDDTKSPDSD